MNNPTIGWIGLGKIGTPMAEQLVKAGFSVTVYNRHKEKEHALTAMGAATAATPAELLQQTDIVILMISDDTAVKDVFTHENGLLSADATDKIIINMSTVSPLVSKEMFVLSEAKGNHYLDAPVSGSVKQAQEAQLVIMVGGDEKIFAQVQPVLAAMGKMSIRLGDVGAGNTAKLAVNTLLGFYAQGLAEAVVLAEKNGVNIHDLMTIINNGALANTFTKIKGDAILQDNYHPAFALKHIVKDVGLAKDIGLSTPMGATMFDSFEKAAHGSGEEDIIAIIKQLRQEDAVQGD